MLVVDASVAFKFVVEEPGADAAYEVVTGPDLLIAPDWLLVEAASAMWKQVKFSRLLETHARDNLDALPEFFARLFSSEPLLKPALELAFRLQHEVYDCLYLALAIRENASVITADRKFHNAVAQSAHASRIRLLDG